MSGQVYDGRSAVVALVLLFALSFLGCTPTRPKEEVKIDPDDVGAAEVCNVIYLPPLTAHADAPHPTQTAALAINDAGQIVGYSKGKLQNSGGVWATSQLPVLWGFYAPTDVNTAEGEGFECHPELAETDLVPCVRKLAFATASGTLQGAAMDIANPAVDGELGTAVGWAGVSSTSRRPYRWPKAGAGEDVSGTASLKFPVARGINSREVVSGTTWDETPQNTIRGFVVSSSTKNVAPQLQRITVDGTADIAAGALQGAPVLYREAPSPFGVTSQVIALDGYGSAVDLVATRAGVLLVGSAQPGSGPAMPASWLVRRATPGGSVIGLPTRPAPTFLKSESGAAAGTARGVSLVGREVHVVGVAERPVLWKGEELGGDLAKFVLPSCSGTLLDANDINSSGHVVGIAQLGPGVERRGFFLRPQVITMYDPDKLGIVKEIIGATEESGELHVIEGSVVTFRFQLSHQYSQTVWATVHEKLPAGVTYWGADGGTCDDEETPWERVIGSHVRDVKIPPDGCYVDMHVRVTGSPGEEIDNAEYKLVAGNEKLGEALKATIDEDPSPPPTLSKTRYGLTCPGSTINYSFDVEDVSGDYTLVEQLPAELENGTNSAWPAGCREWVDQGSGTYQVAASPGDRVCSLFADIKSSVSPGTHVNNDQYRLRLSDPPNNTYAGAPEGFTVTAPPPPPIIDAQFVMPDSNASLETAAPDETVNLVFVVSGELVVSGDCATSVMRVTLPPELEFVGTGGYSGVDCPFAWTCDTNPSGESTECTAPVTGPDPFFGLYGACPLTAAVGAAQPVGTTISVTDYNLEMTGCPCGGGFFVGPAPWLVVTAP